MTIKNAQLTLAALGLTLKRTGHGTEFRVAFRGLGPESEATAYYTDDLSDAVATGRQMAAQGAPDEAQLAARRAIRAAGFDPDRTPKTSVTVNNLLKALGHAERLVRGNGYWYFVDGDAMMWYSSSVPVCRITDLPLYRWAQERDHLAGTAGRSPLRSL